MAELAVAKPPGKNIPQSGARWDYNGATFQETIEFDCKSFSVSHKRLTVVKNLLTT